MAGSAEAFVGRAAVAPPEDEQARRGEPEEDEVDRDHVVEDLAVLSPGREQHGEGALQRDREHGRPRAGMDAADALEEDAVGRHRVVDAGRGEHRLAEEPEGRDRDPRRDEPRSGGAERALHHRGCGSEGLGQARSPQGAHAHPVHAEVERDHAAHAEEEAAGQVALRVPQLTGDEAGRLPSSVGEEDGGHGGAEGEHGLDSVARARRGRRGGRGRDEQPPAHDEGGDGGDLEDHQRRLNAAAHGDAETVHGGEDEQRGHAERRLRKRKREQPSRVAREDEGHRRHASRLHDEQEDPAVQECGQRMIGVAQVRVLSTHSRPTRGQLRVDQRAQERHHAARGPRAQQPGGRRQLDRDFARVGEDAGAHDAAHDDHRRVEGADAAGETGRVGGRGSHGGAMLVETAPHPSREANESAPLTS
jgi:hypothetical protein